MGRAPQQTDSPCESKADTGNNAQMPQQAAIGPEINFAAG